MRILFISRWFPFPPSNGSRLRVMHLLRGLSQQQHHVTLISFSDQPEIDIQAARDIADIHDVQTVYRKPFDPYSLRAQLGYLSLTPRAIFDTYSHQMANKIRQSALNQPYDLVIASQYDSASYAEYFKHIPALFEEVELGVPYGNFQQAPPGWERFRRRLTWYKHQSYLRQLLEYFSACTVVSKEERALLAETAPDFSRASIIPNGVDLHSYQHIQATPQENTLIFTGAFQYQANYDAMRWFVKDIYPLIQAKSPGIQLVITGDHAGKPLPAGKNITLTGFVDNIYQRIASASISIVPILIGGGTRLKIIEALALKTPVVSTTKGAEGLDVENEKHLLIADTPTAFADAVLRLLNNPALRCRLAENGYKLIQEKYDWSVILPQFINLVEHVAATN